MSSGLPSLGMADPMIMASLGSLMNTLQGSNVQTPLQGQSQAEVEQAAAQVKAANDAANQAAQNYGQLAGQPAPQVSPASESLQSLIGNTASVLGGNPQYSRNAQQRIQQQRMDLLQNRAQQLQAAKDDFDRKQAAATWLGRADIAGEYRDESIMLGKSLQGVLDQLHQEHDLLGKVQLSELAHTHKLSEIDAAGKFKALAGGADVENAHDFAQALVDGRISPKLLSGRPTKQTLAVVSEMTKIDPHFNQAEAALDYGAKERFTATLNGRQQVQIRQSADTVMPGLDKLEDLNRQLTAAIPRSNIKMLDNVSVAATKDWATAGPEAQALATQLRALAVTIVPELANIYQAGGVPTEQAMKLAEQAIDPRATPNQLLAQIKLARQNLSWKIGAIKNVLPLGPTGSPVGIHGSNEQSDESRLLAADKLRLKYMAEDGNVIGFKDLIKQNPALDNDPDVITYARKLKGK